MLFLHLINTLNIVHICYNQRQYMIFQQLISIRKNKQFD